MACHVLPCIALAVVSEWCQESVDYASPIPLAQCASLSRGVLEITHLSDAAAFGLRQGLQTGHGAARLHHHTAQKMFVRLLLLTKASSSSELSKTARTKRTLISSLERSPATSNVSPPPTSSVPWPLPGHRRQQHSHKGWYK
jgi:hypothetical protein